MDALGRPTPLTLLTAWTVQPLALALILALAIPYALGVRRLARDGRPWPVGRTVTYAVGLLLLLWLTNGFGQVYGRALYWVWTTQTLTLWLGVPLLVLYGAPIQLARALHPHGAVDRALDSRVVRMLSNPLIAPALVPALSFAFFFGPLPGATIATAPVGWLFQLVLLLLGALMVLPLIGIDDGASSLAVGLSLAVGSFELVIDALPGIVLRLHTGLVTSWFDHRLVTTWAPTPLHDQQLAGGILWCVAEIIDLPFLALVFRRWQRADARDAAHVDAVLEAERVARAALQPESDDAPATVADRRDPEGWDRPWWLSDPEMQQRLKRPH